MFTKEAQIRDWVNQYLKGSLTYEEFMNTFISQTWDLHKTRYTKAQKLSNRVDNLFIRYSEDFLTKKELKNKLKDIVMEKKSERVRQKLMEDYSKAWNKLAEE